MSGMRLDDHLAVEPQIEPQHAVRRRMLRPHRQRHLGLERLIEDLELAGMLSTRTHDVVIVVDDSLN